MEVQTGKQTQITFNSFHNTINLSGKELQKRRKKASSQDSIVLDFFISHPSHQFTASQVTAELHKLGHRFIKDSVKRAISNLSSAKDNKKPFLRKTKTLIPGPYGVGEHLYELIK